LTTLPVTIASNARGAFVLVARNLAGSSDSFPNAGNTISVASSTDERDSDGDGVPDGLEVLLGSDPFDPTSVPNVNALSSGEAEATAFSTLNTAGNTGGEPVQMEANGLAFSVLNSAGAILTVPTANEVQATPFSALNVAAFTGGQPLRTQIDALAFSVLNSADATHGLPTFSEVSATPFSVTNTGLTTTPSGTLSEVDANPFSVLNAFAMTGGQPTALQVTGVSFLVVNEAPPGSVGGGGAANPPTAMEADAVVFSVNNISPSAPLDVRYVGVVQANGSRRLDEHAN
jgi:hypothetical protein